MIFKKKINKLYLALILTTFFISSTSISNADTSAPTSGTHKTGMDATITNTVAPMYDVTIETTGEISWDARNMKSSSSATTKFINNSTASVSIKMDEVVVSGDITPQLIPYMGNVNWGSLDPEAAETKVYIQSNYGGSFTNKVYGDDGYGRNQEAKAISYNSQLNKIVGHAKNTKEHNMGAAIGRLAEGAEGTLTHSIHAGKYFARDRAFRVDFTFSGQLVY